MKLFARLSEIAEMLNCSERAALHALEAHGIRPYDHGTGRGCGKVWYLPAIQQLAADMHDEAQKKAKPEKKRIPMSDGHLIAGKSVAELKLLLTNSAAPVQ